MVPSSSGLGHHPLKVEARVRIPLGLLIDLNPKRVEWTRVARASDQRLKVSLCRYRAPLLGRPRTLRTFEACKYVTLESRWNTY